MAVPYRSVHENSEVLNDFGLDNEFGFLDSQYLQSIVNVQQAAAFGSNDVANFGNHVDATTPMSQLAESLRQELQQEQAEEEAGVHDDINTWPWFYSGPVNRQSNLKLSHHPQVQINSAISSPGWALVQEKEVDGTHNEQQQPLDMSWEDMSITLDNHKQPHILTGNSISSAARDFSGDTNSKPFQEVRSLSDTALGSFFGHPDMSLMSTSTDGESKSPQQVHRRSMSCQSVDSTVDFKFSSNNQRMQHQQLHFPGEEEGLIEIAKATDVSDMLIDLESKLVASLKTKAASPRQQQQLQGGEHMIYQRNMDPQTLTESMILRSATPPPPSNSRLRRDSQTSLEPPGLEPSNNCDPIPAAGVGTGSVGASAAQWQTQLHQQPFSQDEPGIRLVNLLVGCADSVASKNFTQAYSILRELSVMVSPYGDTIQRVASYFTYGLAAHMAGTGSGQNLYRALGINEPSAADTFEAFQVFCEVCPFIKFGEIATTQAVLEAFSGEDNVHFIDLGMAQGSQWLRLLQGLATRNGGPPKVVHLTGVQVKPNPRSTESLSNDHQHGKQLKEFAEKLHLNFSCQLISVERLEKIQSWMLTRESGQAIAVNCSAKLHTLLHHQDSHDLSNPAINHVLSIVHSLRPKLFSLLEQEAKHNVPHFLPRFLEALHFYSAMFDSLDASFSRVSPERAKVEQLWLGQEIINIIACEGRERVERHERLQQWRARLSKAGFRPLPLSDIAVLQVKTFPRIAFGTGFTVLESRARGSLILSWQDRPLFSCSTWTC